MTSRSIFSGRDKALFAIFKKSLDGKAPVTTKHESDRFLQAFDVMATKKSPVYCVECIVSSQNGLEVLSSLVRRDGSQENVVAMMDRLIKHLADPQVNAISNGEFLKKILVAILDPPIFWTWMLLHFRHNRLTLPNIQWFAWLCLQVVSLRCDELQLPYENICEIMKEKLLLGSAASEMVRKYAYRIEKMIQIQTISCKAEIDYSPGGRHDNDFANFRSIALLPTSDEIKSKDEPYLQRLDDVFEVRRELRAVTYLDWLFRLLREDMLANLREDLPIVWNKPKGKRRYTSLSELSLSREVASKGGRRSPLSLFLQFRQGIKFPEKYAKTKATRKKFLDDSKSILKHGSLGVLCLDKDIIAFGSVVREIELLAASPPVAIIKFTSGHGLKRAIDALLQDSQMKLRFLVVDTATYAYEPILQRLQQINEIALEDVLLEPKSDSCIYQPPKAMAVVINALKLALESNQKVNLASLITAPQPIKVSGAQLESLINGLERPIGQIQGPPGTGKSFIGAIISLLTLKFTKHRVLVLSYTNHALDQFLEDLLDIGVEQACMVRLGSKFTKRTEPLRLEELAKSGGQFRFSKEIHHTICTRKDMALRLEDEATELRNKLVTKYPAGQDILDFLEFSTGCETYWQAFQVLKEDGFEAVGKNNKKLQPSHLLQMWVNGADLAAIPTNATLSNDCRQVWMLEHTPRQDLFLTWSRCTREKQVEEYIECELLLQTCQEEIDSLYNESKRKVLQSKRIIGCTTNAAARYQSIIQSAAPDVILVEEAGEILEAHIITALSPSVKRLVLIGDHKQLRPKVKSYKLSVAKGDGFNLNVSLFERLIKQGHLFTTLREQHRSHPDISFLTRQLSYENLEDSPKTLGHPTIRGLESRVIFAHHENYEEQFNEIADISDGGSSASKRNVFEAEMVIKMVKYLCQQGYKSENMVVLTPYLGQLSLFRQMIREDHDPYLNDLDYHDLVRAGLMTDAAAGLKKTRLRLSTIDNYQGEEADLVVASLTRSNANGDIGFMFERERLVVLVSRARNGIIMFGNMHTFMKSKKGGQLWTEFLGTLKDKGYLFNGVPVYCERHPEKKALLKSCQDFEQYCPDGGCAEHCGIMLNCGQHRCQRRCHAIADHSKICCIVRVQKECNRGHKTRPLCSEKNRLCKSCEKEDEETKRRVMRDIELEKTRQAQQELYAAENQRLGDEIDRYQRKQAAEIEKKTQREEIAKKESILRNLKDADQRNEALSKAESSSQASKSKNSNNPKIQTNSKVADEWESIKAEEGIDNEALNELMSMIGLESIKEEFLDIKSTMDTKLRQGVSLSEERLSCSLLGNPGTGKTTVAKLWARFLSWIGAVPGSGFEETTGSKLANGGVSACEKLLEKLKDDGGGVLFVDEAYQLSSGNSPGGKAVLDYLLAEVENLRGKVVFAIAGYSKQMESFFAHNPGFPSRFPITMKFEDYTDNELLEILKSQIHRKYNGRMKVEGGSGGLYCRIASRRVGRARGKEGFGNARDIENALARIVKRQSTRLRMERKARNKPDDFLFTKEDVIGPEPSTAFENCEEWTKLQQMIGLGEVKEAVKALIHSLITNYRRELAEEPLMTFSLNKVFLGSPGTGKTSVAKLYGKILAVIGLLSNGEVITKAPADFVGSVLGESEAKTKGILSSTVGKVLVIDEAYGLYSGSSSADIYKTAVVDTIVAEVQNVPGDDRCVLLLGYREQMETMFQNVNPGLSRRFDIDSPFTFHDFDDKDLEKILELKLKEGSLKITDQAKHVAMEMLKRERNRPNFGNAGAIDNLLSKAKSKYQLRASSGKMENDILEASDFDANFDRKGINIKELFADEIGRENTIAKLEAIQHRVNELRALDMDVSDEIPFNFLFRGPPGTGKTVTARKMGEFYYNMGFLSAPIVEECTTTDLIGEFVGQTGPKIQKLLDSAIGRVLFIDEAYRLVGSSFAKEAVDELVDCLTKEKYKGKLIIIMAGYDAEINRLLSINPGMSSRFPESIDFEALDSEACFKLLTKLLEKKKATFEAKGKVVDLTSLTSPTSSFRDDVLRDFQSLSAVDGWANARDVIQLSNDIFRGVDLSQPVFDINEDMIKQQLQAMLSERQTRAQSKLRLVGGEDLQQPMQPLQSLQQTYDVPIQQTSIDIQQQVTEKEEDDDPNEEVKNLAESLLGIRDASVSDEVWEQLKRDALEEQQREKDFQDLKRKQRLASEEDRERIIKQLLEGEQQREKDFQDLKKKQRLAREEDRDRIIKQLLEEERRREEEKAKRAKLKQIGACPVGYRWIKQSGGYRCAGGSHWMSDAEISKVQ